MIIDQLKNLVCFLALTTGSLAWAVPIAVIDSGTDIQHPYLKGKIWINTNETDDVGVDGDRNGYKNDVNGWNFADRSSQLIDPTYFGKFSPDVMKFFDVQLRLSDGTATEEDKNWIKTKKDDTQFIQKLETFANFAHGTHVAGIASHSSDLARIMTAKIVPTEVKDSALMISLLSDSFFKNLSLKVKEFFNTLFMDGTLWFVAKAHAKALTEVGKYVHQTGMRVANCSFGTSIDQAKLVVNELSKTLFHKSLSDEQIDKYAHYFMKQVLSQGASFVTSSKDTLFIFAAGNDGTDNDQLPIYPANLRKENTMTVAATRGYSRLASFSNFGAENVDIAAPGVGIVSSIPGGQMMAMSGTSQAAPFITNLAGRVFDTNPALSLTQVKKVLMQTVDKKDFLEGKVASGGIANVERALYAATLSTQMGLDQLDRAIQRAQHEVKDTDSPLSVLGIRAWHRPSFPSSVDTGYDGDPTPLPSLFQLNQEALL